MQTPSNDELPESIDDGDEEEVVEDSCLYCNGTGMVFSQDDNDEEDKDFKECNHCNGSGVDPNGSVVEDGDYDILDED